jgi:hypothetical protein
VGGEVVGAAGATVGLPVPVSGAVGVVVVGVGDSGPVAGEDSEGEDEGGSDAEGDVVQAEITAEASRATMPQPSAASLALSPVLEAMVCAFMEPPKTPGAINVKPIDGATCNGLFSHWNIRLRD